MLKTVMSTINKHNMLSENETVVLGLSGGADSVCLLHILQSLKLNLRLVAVHVNHGIRGEEADRDENFVKALCVTFDIHLVIRKFDIKNEARVRKLTEEEAGRLIRYQVFEEILSLNGGGKIAVAHHINDLAETFIFNICRGTGMSGIYIPPVRGNVIRPLIDIGREDIIHYCAVHQLSYVTDSTNLSLEYSRNRLRNLIIPELEQHINIKTVQNIKVFSDTLREEDVYIDSAAKEAYNNCRTLESDTGTALDIKRLSVYPPVIQKRVIRLAFNDLNGLKDITHKHVDAVLRLLEQNSGKETCIPEKFQVKREYNRLIFFKNYEKKQDFSYQLVYNESVYIKEAELYVLASLKPLHGSGVYAFDLDKISSLTVRNRRPGDKIYFNSINGHKKLKDFFIDQKIPRPLRDACVLIADGSQVLWMMLSGKNIFSDKYYYDAVHKIYIKVWR